MNDLIKGQCRIDFDNWYSKNIKIELPVHTHMMGQGIVQCSPENFHQLPAYFQFGVVQCFAADVKGWDLYIKPQGKWKRIYLSQACHHLIQESTEFETFPKAHKTAIEKFVIQYNNVSFLTKVESHSLKSSFSGHRNPPPPPPPKMSPEMKKTIADAVAAGEKLANHFLEFSALSISKKSPLTKDSALQLLKNSHNQTRDTEIIIKMACHGFGFRQILRMIRIINSKNQ